MANVYYSAFRYRFRLVSLSCDPNYTFSIDNHTMTVIEADTVNSQPLEVDSIQIFSSQRYSFVVRTTFLSVNPCVSNTSFQLEANQPVDNYWIRAEPNFGNIGFSDGINSAILRYEGAPNAEPIATEAPTLTNPLVESNLHPLASMPVVRDLSPFSPAQNSL